MLVDLGSVVNANDFLEFEFKPKYSKKIVRVGLIANDYNEVSNSFEMELCLWTNNKKNHIGKYPLPVGKDPINVNLDKFIQIDQEIDCSKEIRGYVKSIRAITSKIQLLVILER